MVGIAHMPLDAGEQDRWSRSDVFKLGAALVVGIGILLVRVWVDWP